MSERVKACKYGFFSLKIKCQAFANPQRHCDEMNRSCGLILLLGTFRSDYDNDYEYEFFNMYPMRMRDCVRLSRQLVLSYKSRRRPDANYEIFDKSRPPTTSSLEVQRRVKRLVFKGADTL